MLALSKRVQRRLPRNQVILLGLFCSACWGIASVLSKSSLNEMPAMLLLVVQLVCSNLLLGALVLWKRPVFPARKEVLIFLGVGAISPGLSFTFAMVGLSMTSVTSETLIWSTETIMILFLSWIILREPLGLPLVALSITATVGVICVTGALHSVTHCSSDAACVMRSDGGRARGRHAQQPGRLPGAAGHGVLGHGRDSHAALRRQDRPALAHHALPNQRCAPSLRVS